MANGITFTLLTSSLRLAWAAIRIGQVGQEWAMTTEREHLMVEKLGRFLVGAGETLEAKVDRVATRRGVLVDVLDRVAHEG
jgi:hypothetical protein